MIPPRLATALLLRFGPQNDPVVGDLREAYLRGKSSRWYWSQVLALVCSNAYRAICPSLSGAATAVTAAVLVLELPFLAHSPTPLDPHRWLLMAIYLAPQALVLAVPVGLTIGMVGGPPSQMPSRLQPLMLIAAAFGSLMTFVMAGWVVPAANQAYRVTAIDSDALRGVAELTFGELHSLMKTSQSSMFAVAQSSERWDVMAHYYGRWATSCAPLAFALFGICAMSLSRMSRRIVAIAVACAYLAYFLIAPEWLKAFPPLVVAWAPTTAVAVLAVLIWQVSRFRASAVSNGESSPP